MPVQLFKSNPDGARQAAQRAAEAQDAMVAFAHALAPAVRKAGTDMARSLQGIRVKRSA
ncbi:hypothetical protein ABZY90_19695 [Streptomyces sp. NPDC006422]|uniref:hypothetical protein n=1 Tax=unclassified Streptomyces TaxID=2593676 RepID=UPI0033BA247D